MFVLRVPYKWKCFLIFRMKGHSDFTAAVKLDWNVSFGVHSAWEWKQHDNHSFQSDEFEQWRENIKLDMSNIIGTLKNLVILIDFCHIFCLYPYQNFILIKYITLKIFHLYYIK